MNLLDNRIALDLCRKIYISRLINTIQRVGPKWNPRSSLFQISHFKAQNSVAKSKKYDNDN